MKILLMTLLGAALLAAPLRAADGFKNDEERTVYALGYLLGQNIQVFELTPAQLKILDLGVNAGAAKKPAAISIDLYRPRVQELANRRWPHGGKSAPASRKAYAENSSRPVQPSQAAGTRSRKAKAAGDRGEHLNVHYRGTASMGPSSTALKRGARSRRFKGGVISCWINALGPEGRPRRSSSAPPTRSRRRRPGSKGGETRLFDNDFVEMEKPALPKAADKPAKR